ncbi:HXXEE domain-containing protein [Brevibacillus sp. 179-C9.3 HS]|uniref:HXXEE domain-containing protein n=1 Tax=unclassified Brevibacillus TaxID=2684853 RepID=UPI00399FCA27
MLELSHLIWLFLVVFMFHDFEEIVMVEGWVRAKKELIRQTVPARLMKLMEPSFAMNTAQFAVAVSCIFAVLSAAVILTVTTFSTGTYLPFFLVCLHVMFLHVFMHVGHTVVLRTYTPGVVTAVALVLPYSLYTYFRLLEAGLVTWPMIWSTLPYSLLIIPVLYMAHRIGEAAGKLIPR